MNIFFVPTLLSQEKRWTVKELHLLVKLQNYNFSLDRAAQSLHLYHNIYIAKGISLKTCCSCPFFNKTAQLDLL